jgi:hypothetical protein
VNDIFLAEFQVFTQIGCKIEPPVIIAGASSQKSDEYS